MQKIYTIQYLQFQTNEEITSFMENRGERNHYVYQIMKTDQSLLSSRTEKENITFIIFRKLTQPVTSFI